MDVNCFILFRWEWIEQALKSSAITPEYWCSFLEFNVKHYSLVFDHNADKQLNYIFFFAFKKQKKYPLTQNKRLKKLGKSLFECRTPWKCQS